MNFLIFYYSIKSRKICPSQPFQSFKYQIENKKVIAFSIKNSLSHFIVLEKKFFFDFREKKFRFKCACIELLIWSLLEIPIFSEMSPPIEFNQLSTRFSIRHNITLEHSKSFRFIPFWTDKFALTDNRKKNKFSS